jgi:deoxycytidylate deaminase
VKTENGVRGLAQVLAENSQCTRSHVGAVLVDSQLTILGLGWNKGRQCAALCPRGSKTLAEMPSNTSFSALPCITQHAEMSALESVQEPVPPGSVMYVAVLPDPNRGVCERCQRVLDALGISTVHVGRTDVEKQAE